MTVAAATMKVLRTARNAMARRDSATFAELVGRDEQDHTPFKLAPSHVRFHQLAAAHPRLTFLAHFSWGKTSHAIQLIAHRIGVNLATRILYVCASHGEAQKRTRLLLSYLKSAAYKQVFPNVEIARESDSAITVKRPVLAKDATFQAIGIGSEFLGSRADGIALDDVSTLEDAQSEAVRTRKVEIVRSMLLPRLAPGGWALCIATPWCQNDVSDVLAHTPGWHLERVPVVDPVTGQPNWPEKFPPERIQALRAELGPFASARALDLMLIDDSMARFRREWVSKALSRGAGLGFLHQYSALGMKDSYTVVGVDLGISQKPGADLTSFATIAVAPNGDRRLLNVESGRWTADQIIEKIIFHNHRYDPRNIVVESVAAQQFVVDLVRKASAVPVIGFHTAGGKMSLPYQSELLAAEFANQKWILPSGDGQLHPEVAALVHDLISYQPSEHCGDRLAALLFARWAAGQASQKAIVGRLINNYAGGRW